jgi:EmrB/QacA subfamily drug resistance transporter
LIAVLLGTLLSALDQTIVTTAGPKIMAELHVSPSLYDWISSSYSLASTVLVPVWGKLSDIYGRRSVLVAGMLVFLFGSLGCGLAHGFTSLVLFRAVQGAGAASLLTTALAVTADLFPPAVRGKYNGLFAAIWGVASVLGPLAGGLITDHASWHWTFLVNLPIGAVALGFVVAKMPQLGGGLPARVDGLGVLTLCLATVPLLLALTLGRGELGGDTAVLHTRWGDPRVLALLALACVGIGAFFEVQRRSRFPVIDLRYFEAPVFRWGIIGTAAFGMAAFSSIIFTPLFMQYALGKSSTQAGLLLTPLPVGLVIGNVASGQLVSRLGHYKGLMIGAASGAVVVHAALAFWLGPEMSDRGIMIALGLLGLTIGPILPLFALAIQNGMPTRELGSSTAVVTFFRQIGSTVGMAVNGALFAAVLSRHADQPAAAGFTRAVSAVFWLGAALCAIGLAATIALPGHPLRKSH